LVSHNVSETQTINEYHKAIEKNNMYNIKILTPYKECVKRINTKLNEYWEHSGENVGFNIGDCIMFTKNDYEKNIFNGQEGIIINADKNYSHVLIGQNTKIFDTVYLNKHAKNSACITISKSQGDEWDVVIIYIPANIKYNEDFITLNLLYTAMSRCIKKVVIVCTENDFYNILNTTMNEKCSNIPQRITKLINNGTNIY